MSMRPFTSPWADAFCAAVNASDAYRDAGRSWAWPLALVLARAPEYGYDADVAVELALDRGRCHDARIVAGDSVSAPFALRGDYPTWKSIVKGEVDPVGAVMRGRLALVRGAVMTLMLHAHSSQVLLQCARAVPIVFPDEDVRLP